MPRIIAAKIIIFCLLFANLFVWLAVFGQTPASIIQVNFFDVGQGDAAFVQIGNGVQILIDGGPGNSILQKLGDSMPFYDRDIDWVVLSHPDRDHLAGLLRVMEDYRVRNVIWPGIADESAENQKWRKLIAEEGARIITPQKAGLIKLDGFRGCFMEIIPPDSSVLHSSGGRNDFSLAARLVCGKKSFLFTGDAQKIAGTVSANVLKVAHHGSKYSTTESFLVDVMPEIAVISVGRNSYGHPAPEVLEMMAKYDIKTLRTDQSGDILFRTDGQVLFVKTQK